MPSEKPAGSMAVLVESAAIHCALSGMFLMPGTFGIGSGSEIAPLESVIAGTATQDIVARVASDPRAIA